MADATKLTGVRQHAALHMTCLRRQLARLNAQRRCRKATDATEKRSKVPMSGDGDKEHNAWDMTFRKADEGLETYKAVK
jgi:hypothetical protein